MKLRLPNPLARRPSIVRTPLPGFDPIYYLYWYPDIRAAGLDPMRHYLLIGWKEGRDPSAGFSTSGYLASNPDVACTDQNPLVHFVNVGLTEGRGGYAKDSSAAAPRPRSNSELIKLLTGPNAAAATPLQGYVDEISHRSVRGWALPLNSPGTPAEIQIMVNDALMGRVIANEFRTDLYEEGIGDARHGFLFEFSPPLNVDYGQTVIIRRTADGFEVGRSVL